MPSFHILYGLQHPSLQRGVSILLEEAANLSQTAVTSAASVPPRSLIQSLNAKEHELRDLGPADLVAQPAAEGAGQTAPPERPGRRTAWD